MCGRFTLKTPAERLAEHFGLDPADLPELSPRYNVAPTQPVAVVRRAGDGRALDLIRWGLVPSWADDPSVGSRMINARAETVAEKPAYRSAFRQRRCLVAADGFYEWARPPGGGPKRPYYFRLPGGGPFAFAGLWERWDKGGTPLLTCTLLTTGANGRVAPVHDRMPVILPPEAYEAWLDPRAATRPDDLLALLAPWPDDRTEAVPVGRWVNSPSVDDPRCTEPLAP